MTKFIYVEMVCKLDRKDYDDELPIDGIAIEPVQNIDMDELFACYTRAFRRGDAQFYKLQDEAAHRQFFDEELGFPYVLANPASFTLKIGDEIIGFTLVLETSETNYHISCMCLLPSYQGIGLGQAMLNRIKNIAVENGCWSLTLGTEPEMKAYRLYVKGGFSVTEEYIVSM